jgi:VCBS repeat protein
MAAPLAAALVLLAQFEPHAAPVQSAQILGAAMAGHDRLITWGDGLTEWKLGDWSKRSLAAGRFARGGCLMDVDLDGWLDLVVQEGEGLGRLVWHRAPDFVKAQVIDSAIEIPDCLSATLYGRRGLLIVQRHAQVRFYEPPSDLSSRWPYREIYSFYTNSRQAGLLINDVDGDGRADILCGNYWIRAPETFDLPWRLFAINTDHNAPDSATARLALTPDLIFSQGEMAETRIGVFRKPAIVSQLWLEERLEPTVHYPRGLAAADFDADGLIDFVVSDNRPAGSRLILFRNLGNGRYEPLPVGATPVVHSLFVVDVDRDGRPDLVAVGPSNLTWWKNGYLRK